MSVPTTLLCSISDLLICVNQAVSEQSKGQDYSQPVPGTILEHHQRLYFYPTYMTYKPNTVLVSRTFVFMVK